jgi:hypothetical protein
VKKVTVQIVDDLSGSVIPDGDGRSITFSFDGESFEIDLSNEHVEQFRDLLAPYINAARQVGKRRRTLVAKSPEVQAIRDWARANGIEVSDRGRISATVREAYAASL